MISCSNKTPQFILIFRNAEYDYYIICNQFTKGEINIIYRVSVDFDESTTIMTIIEITCCIEQVRSENST
jgi:hypothetical protein